MATRTTTKSTLKPTIVDAPQAENVGSFFQSMIAGFELPSGKRVLVSFVAAMIAGGCTLYLGMQLTAFLAVGAAMLTGSAFLAFLALFMGYALSILATVIISGKVQSFILNGDIDRTYQATKAKVTGWFSSAKSSMIGGAA